MNQHGDGTPHTDGLGRRGFLGKAAATAAVFGAASRGTVPPAATAATADAVTANAAGSARDGMPDKLPREVTVATISQDGLNANTPAKVVTKMIQRCQQAATQQLDLVCLPEVCPCLTLPNGSYDLADVAGDPIGPLTQPFADFA